MRSLGRDGDTLLGFPFEIVPGSETEDRHRGDLWAQGGLTKGTHMIFIVACLHPPPRRCGRLLRRRASEWQLGPLSSPSLSLQPCPGFLCSQPEDPRWTLHAVRASLPNTHFCMFQIYALRERVYSNYTKYHPLLYL